MIDEKVSNRITSVRWILILLVLYIHNTDPITYDLVNSHSINYITKFFQELITYSIAIASVPVFFIFSGFLVSKKNDSFVTNGIKKVKSLLVPYIFWNLLAIIFYYLVLKQKFINANVVSDNNILEYKVKDVFFALTGYGRKDLGPIAFQFWFIRDLFILNLLIPVVNFCLRKIPLVYFCFVLYLYLIFPYIFIFKSQSLFFFSIGYYIGLDEDDNKLFRIVDKVALWEYICLIVLFSILSSLGVLHSSLHYVRLLLAIGLILKISSILSSNEKLYEKCKKLSGYSFWVFAIHAPIVSNTLIQLQKKFVIDNPWADSIVHFIFVFTVTFIFLYCIYANCKSI